MSFQKNSKEQIEDVSEKNKQDKSYPTFYNSQVKSPKRAFYHPLNSLMGHAFADYNATLGKREYLIVGTCDHNDESPAPLEVAKVFNRSMPLKDLLYIMADCEVIIFESLKTELELLEAVIGHFETTQYANPKTVILMSHPLIWYETKISRNSFLDSFENIPPQNALKSDPRAQKRSKLLNQEPSRITDADFFERRTLPCYELHRLIENRIYSLNESNPTVSGSVLLPGLIFGRGEDDLYPFFESLIASPSSPSLIVGKGDNSIPTIHCMDLAANVFALLAAPKPLKSFYLCSNDERVTQRQLFFEFCKVSGLEKLAESSSYEHMLDPSYEILTLNMLLQSSAIFCQPQLRANKSQSLEKLNSIPKLEDSRPVSILEHFDQVLGEFIKFRSVSLTRMILICPDVIIENNELLSSIKKSLEVDVIRMDEVINQLLTTSSENEALKLEIEQAIEVAREDQFVKQTEIYNEAKKQKKKSVVQPVKSAIKVDIFNALKDETYFKILLSILQKPKYKIRGFVLVNAISDLQKAPYFVQKIQKECNFGGVEVMIFNFSPLKLQAKLNELEGQLKANPKSEAMIQSAEQIRKLLDDLSPLAHEIDHEFYGNGLIEVVFSDVKIDLDILTKRYKEKSILIDANEDAPAPAKSSVQSLESNKQPSAEHLPNRSEGPTLVVPPVITSKRNSKTFAENAFPKLKDDGQEALNEEEAILNLKSASIKQYLADNVLPDITEGIIEICKEKPNDPVKFLIEFLKTKVTEN